jgi:GNAT superfamily N-acetyltransferase
MAGELRIRDALPSDSAVIYRLVRELAEYEKLLHEVVSTEADLARDLFRANPHLFAMVAEADGEPVGIAIWHYTYSTFAGRHGIWLEDLYVRPAHRGKGYGKAVLQHLAARAVADDCRFLEWNVLDWNEPAIRFYESLGAKSFEGWITKFIEGAALKRLAGN